LGSVLHRLGDLPGAITAQVAVVWDAPSWWALRGPGLPIPDLDYDTWVRGVHAAAWRAGVTVDVIGPSSDLTPYRLVLVPCLYLLSDTAAGAMRSYVESGGCLVAWFLTGTADVDNRIRLDGRGALSDTLGVRVEEFHPTAEVALSDGDKGRVWSELVRLDGAEVVTRYASGVLDGEPAVTRNQLGAGAAWYVSTWLAPDRLLEGILTQVGVAVSGAVAGVEVVRRGDYLFAINHTDRAQEIAAKGKDLISGRLVDGVLRLAAGDYAVLSET
jgi:beta-galactosidase